MFSSINSRLWITYVLLVAFVLVSALLGIIIAFRNSPLLYWKEFVRLNYVTDSLGNLLDYFPLHNWDDLVDLFLKESGSANVRVGVIDPSGELYFASSNPQKESLPVILNPEAAYLRTEGNIHLYRDENQQVWFYKINPIDEDYYLLTAILRPKLRLRTIFQDELLNPLFKVGIIAMMMALVISWFVARWITQPLQKITESTRQLALGDFPPIRQEGPREVRQLAEVINEMDRKVRDGFQSQKDFVSNVSHEFKTPLTAIQGFSQAIIDRTVSKKEERKHAAEVILEETNRLNYLVNDLLTLAKLDAGTMVLEKRKTAIVPLIDSVIEKFHFQTETKHLKIESAYADRPQTVVDGERMVQVFSNLLDNAIKFTNDGGEIWISVVSDLENCTISIRDSGKGIPKEEINRIFDRFFQVDRSRGKGSERGVGLGLSIAQQIVEAHDGKISVTSELGKGSCFMVKLPLADEQSE